MLNSEVSLGGGGNVEPVPCEGVLAAVAAGKAGG